MRASFKCHFLEIILIKHKELKYSSFMVDWNSFFIKNGFEQNPFYFTDRVCLCQVWFKHSKNIREHYNYVLLTNKLKNYTLNFRLCIFLCVWGFSVCLFTWCLIVHKASTDHLHFVLFTTTTCTLLLRITSALFPSFSSQSFTMFLVYPFSGFSFKNGEQISSML